MVKSIYYLEKLYLIALPIFKQDKSFCSHCAEFDFSY